MALAGTGTVGCPSERPRSRAEANLCDRGPPCRGEGQDRIRVARRGSLRNRFVASVRFGIANLHYPLRLSNRAAKAVLDREPAVAGMQRDAKKRNPAWKRHDHDTETVMLRHGPCIGCAT